MEKLGERELIYAGFVELGKSTVGEVQEVLREQEMKSPIRPYRRC
jgi:hypothetical protein